MFPKKTVTIFLILALLTAVFNFISVQIGRAFALTAWDFTFLWLLLLPTSDPKIKRFISVVCFLGLFIGLFTTGIRGYLWNCYGTTPNTAFTLGALANTNFNESLEFIAHDFYFIAVWFALTLVSILVCAYLLYRFYKSSQLVKTGVIAYSLLFSTLIVAVIGWTVKPIRKNLPPYTLISTISGVNKYKQDWQLRKSSLQEELKLASFSIADKTSENETIVLVIGESTCRDNFSLYGYPRLTTPLLDQQAKSGNLLFVPNAWSTAAGTIAAFNSMFNFPVNVDGRMIDLNLFAVFKAAGWNIYWIANQDDHAIDSTYISFADKVFKLNRTTGRSVQSLDEKVLPIFSEIMAETAPGKRLIVVHLIGIHPNFSIRYPKGFKTKWSDNDTIAKALEDSDRSIFTKSKRKEYDTAVSYQDEILNRLLEITKTHAGGNPTFWFFISDHSVETGACFDKTGHKFDSITSYKIPMLVWGNRKLLLSEAFTDKNESGFRADWLYAPLLEVAGIQLKDNSINQRSIFNSNYRFVIPENIKRLQSTGCPNPLLFR